LSRRNCAWKSLCFWRAAGQAIGTRVVFSHGAPCRVRVERRLPARSSTRGHKPAPTGDGLPTERPTCRRRFLPR
jgi:hypothetical protein